MSKIAIKTIHSKDKKYNKCLFILNSKESSMALKGIFTGQSSWCTYILGSNDLLTLMKLVALMFWLDFSNQHMPVSFLKREQKLRKCSHQVDL